MHHGELKKRFNNGSLSHAAIVAARANGYWHVVVNDIDEGDITLACSQSHYPCLYSSLDEAAAVVRDIGFQRFEVLREALAVPA
ncbi:MAG: hypothetical protein II007_03970 [Gammaproteobacteria bacterium]|nr:hypothetical protein [Gammaproteobacteria bacterium]